MKDFKVSSATIESYGDKDWIYYNDIIEKPSCNFENTLKIQYNQKEVHKRSCFLHAPFTALTALTWYKFTLEERKAIVGQAFDTEWADESYWGYFKESCKFLAKWYNENKVSKDQHIWYYRIWKDKFEKALNKWYLIISGYTVEQGQRADWNDDWIYNNSWGEYWKDYWGHCICVWNVDWKRSIIDNYPWDKTNVIEDWWTLKMFKNWYIFVIKEDVRDGFEGLSVEDKKAKLRKTK